MKDRPNPPSSFPTRKAKGGVGEWESGRRKRRKGERESGRAREESFPHSLFCFFSLSPVRFFAFSPFALWKRGWGRGLFFLLFFSCSRIEEQPVGQAAQGVRGPDQEAWGWESRVTKGGVRRAIIRAGRYRHFGLSRVDSLDQGVVVTFFDPSGRRASVLRSRMGAVEEGDRRMLALGGVVVTAEDSTTLEADALQWDNERERITGDGPVTIRRADGVETGVGFESTPDLKRWSMRNVTTKKTR